MQYLFNSKGQYIANLTNNQLYSPSGKNIGHLLKKENIFIDMRGHYLGEIMHNDRLLYNLSSPHKNVNYGSYGSYGSIGSYGTPGNRGSIGMFAGYQDISTPWL